MDGDVEAVLVRVDAVDAGWGAALRGELEAQAVLVGARVKAVVELVELCGGGVR